MTELSSWLNTVSSELGITDVELDNNDIHTLLDLARDSAHEVERLAAPLTSYLVGVAVGRGASLGSVAAKVTALALPSPTNRAVGRQRLIWARATTVGAMGAARRVRRRAGHRLRQPGRVAAARLAEREIRNATTISNEQAPIQPYEQVFSRVITDADQWQRVTARGTFDGDHQFVVRNRNNGDDRGYEVVTPLRTATGTVLVDRGFIAIAPAPGYRPSGRHRRPARSPWSATSAATSKAAAAPSPRSPGRSG